MTQQIAEKDKTRAKKTQVLLVRLTELEKEKLQRITKTFGLQSTSKLVRTLLTKLMSDWDNRPSSTP